MANLQKIKMIRVPFNYRRQRHGKVAVIRELGAFPVGLGKGEVHPDIAQAAIEAGYAQPFDPRASKPTTPRRRSAKKSNAANSRQSDGMGVAGVPADGRPDDQPSMADAG